MRTDEAQGKITQSEAIAKHELYISIMDALSFHNNHEVNFTLDNLKKFIAEIETQAEVLGITSELGMRIFFAAVNESKDGELTPKLTAFLTPTHENQGEIKNTGGLYLNYGNSGVSSLIDNNK